jgi:hypothetical protein
MTFNKERVGAAVADGPVAPPPDSYTPKVHRGRKPGSKNRPKQSPAVDTSPDRRIKEKPVDLSRLYEIHAELIARKHRIEIILGHLEGAIAVLGNEASL